MFRKKIPASAYSLDGPAWPVFVISLPDMTERRTAITRQCDAFGITPVFIDAIDGRSGLPPDYEPLVDRAAMQARIGRKATDGEFACALSHRLAYSRIIAEGHKGGVIIEDDAILTLPFRDFLRGRGYQCADFIQMDHHLAKGYLFGQMHWSAHTVLIPMVENTYPATGYSLSRSAAQYLIEQTTPLAGLADWPCDMQPVSPMATLPRLVQGPSDGGAGSSLEAARKPLVNAHSAEKDAAFAAIVREPRKRKSPFRYFTRAYWKAWHIKHLSFRIS